MSDLETKTKKRTTSIITVFLWLLLIVVMSTILIGSVFQENKLEYVRTITIKVDFTELLNDPSISQEYVKNEIIQKFGGLIGFYEYPNYNYDYNSYYGLQYIGLEGNVATYKAENVYNLHYMQIEILNGLSFNILENGKVLKSGINEYGNLYFEKKLDEWDQIYELKIQKLDFDTEATIKVDFTDFFNNTNVSQWEKQDTSNNFVKSSLFLAGNDKNRIRYYSEFNGLDGNIASYKVFFNATEAGYLCYLKGGSDYVLFENEKVVESYQDEWNNWCFTKSLIEGQDIYNFEFKKMQLDSKVTLKVDFSDFLNDDTIPEDDKKNKIEDFFYYDSFLFSDKNLYIETNYLGLEENIATCEIAYNASNVNYLGFYNGSFNILENGELLEVQKDDLGNTFSVKEIVDDQDVYEFEAQNIKINIDTEVILKIDFSDLFNDEYFQEDVIKEEIIPSFVKYNVYLTKDHEYEKEYFSEYLGLEGNIATYKISFDSSEVNYIDFDSYFVILENGGLLENYHIKNGDEEYNFYYTKEIIEGQNVYEFEIKPNYFMRISIEKLVAPESFRMLLYFEDSVVDVMERAGENWYLSYYPVYGVEYTICFEFEKDKLESGLEYYVYDEEGTLLDFKDGKYYKTVTYTGEEYNFKIAPKEENLSLSQIYSNVEWIDQEKKEALLEFGVDNSVYMHKYNYVVFAEKLADGFTISSEYENSPNWLIVNEDEIIDNEFIDRSFLVKLDLDNNEYIPEHVYANLFFFTDWRIRWSGQNQYIYLKDKNIVYGIVKYSAPYTKIHVQYQGDIVEGSLPVNFETKVISFYDVLGGGCFDYYDQYYTGSTLEGKTLNLTNSTTAKIDVNKIIKSETENGIYYVGLFENEEIGKTDKIYQIDTVDGMGSTTITIENYDGTKPYYIYEVDVFGNKIYSEELEYSKNKVLENAESQEENEIVTDKNFVSMIGTSDPDVTGIGLGEKYYNNNTLNINHVYKDTVTIAEKYEEKVHVVKFEAGEGGSIEGEVSIVVKDGETIDTMVNAIANEHYSFDKWIVIENGVEKEVDPSSYVITKDTTFIAKFKKDSYTVKYESAEGGRLEGNLEERVEYGNSPVLVPSIVLDKNYEFDKWVIIENGVEIEVNLSGYKVEKDVTFIAKYKKIEKTETSDIEVWKYVGIGISSVLVIAIIVVLIVIRKKNKNKSK